MKILRGLRGEGISKAGMLPFSFVFALSLSCWMDENYLNPTCRFIFILPSWITFTYLVVFSYRSFMQYVWKVLRESKSFKTNKNHVFPLVFFLRSGLLLFLCAYYFFDGVRKNLYGHVWDGMWVWWVFGFFHFEKSAFIQDKNASF